MKTIQGPGIFLAQFIGAAAPFNTLEGLAGWAASLGYQGVQIPTSDAHIFDLKRAAESDAYCVRSVCGVNSRMTASCTIRWRSMRS